MKFHPQGQMSEREYHLDSKLAVQSKEVTQSVLLET
jgi:hypothetical protein